MSKIAHITVLDRATGTPLDGAAISLVGQPPFADWIMNGHSGDVIEGHAVPGVWYFKMSGPTADAASPMLVTVHKPGYFGFSQVLPIPVGPSPHGDWYWQVGLLADDHISISGRFFVRGGQNWRYLGCSDFNSFPTHARGGDVRPVARQRRDLGFNTVRSFLYAAPPNVFAVDPRVITPQMIADYLGVMNAEGLRVDLTKGDAQIVLPNQANQIAFQQMVDSVIGNNFNQTCNEPFKNGIDVGAVIPQAGIRSSGDYDDRTVHQHALDFIDYHAARNGSGLAPKWVIDNVEAVLDGFDSSEAPNGHYDAMTIPFISGEPQHFGPSRGIFDSRLAFLLGDKIGRWLAGGTFHTDQGITSELFTGAELACAQEFVRGMTLAPLL